MPQYESDKMLYLAYYRLCRKPPAVINYCQIKMPGTAVLRPPDKRNHLHFSTMTLYDPVASKRNVLVKVIFTLALSHTANNF